MLVSKFCAVFSKKNPIPTAFVVEIGKTSLRFGRNPFHPTKSLVMNNKVRGVLFDTCQGVRKPWRSAKACMSFSRLSAATFIKAQFNSSASALQLCMTEIVKIVQIYLWGSALKIYLWLWKVWRLISEKCCKVFTPLRSHFAGQIDFCFCMVQDVLTVHID